MPPALLRPKPYRFENLPSLTRDEVVLWNWYCRAAPSHGEWRAWVAEIFGRLLEKPAGERLQLVQTHLVDPKVGEKVLSFGSRQELFLGRAADNDVVLAASAISGKHARLFLKDGRAFLEDLGGRLGTYLWDKRIPAREAQPVSIGDQFTVFPYRFRVLLEHCWSPETEVALSECRVQPVNRADFLNQSPPAARTFILSLDSSSQTAVLQVSPPFLAKLQQRILAPLGLERIKGKVPSDDALLGFILLAFLEHLNRKLKFPHHFSFMKSAREGPGPAVRGMFLSFAVAVGGITGPFRIFVPLSLLAAGAPATKGDAAMSCPAEFSWTFPVSAGFVDLTPTEIAGIGLGDILVAQHCAAIVFPQDSGKGWTMVAEGSNFARFKLDKYFDGGSPLETGSEASTAAGRPAIEALPLRLQVIVGEKELTLAEVQALSPGSIVELGAGKTDPVRLMVNGRVLGEGELVDVEGNLAVKVLRWRTG